MADVVVRDAGLDDAYFVSTCSHVHESEEVDACGRRRAAWLSSMRASGLRTQVAAIDGAPVGFVYTMPIEVCPWGPLGGDLMVMPCLWVLPAHAKRGAGTALLEAAVSEARGAGKKGLVTTAYEQYDWFMPASFFAARGFTEVRRKGGSVILWTVIDETAEPPEFLEPRYEFRPVPGKVVVDLFWQTFCQTSAIEAARVREVAAVFGDDVILREHCADDRETLVRYQIPRAIFVNGAEIGWGYEAPREGIRDAIRAALEARGSRG